jgi:osmotically-inducible protein OsmY
MRKIPMVIGGGIGATIAYLFDPDLGRSRRARVLDQMAAKGRRALATLTSRAEYEAGKARGMVHGAMASRRRPRTFDEDTLLQKVRREAVGPWKVDAEEPREIHIEVDGEKVTIEGRVTSPADRERLREMVSNVEGVVQVEDALVVLR